MYILVQILCFSKLHLHLSRVLFNLAGVLHWLGVTGTGTGKGTDKFKITLQWMLEGSNSRTVRAGNRRKGRLSTLRAHTKAPCKTDLLSKRLRNAKAA
jgi:hypothetical protein